MKYSKFVFKKMVFLLAILIVFSSMHLVFAEENMPADDAISSEENVSVVDETSTEEDASAI
ncbi:MAG TPA: hypothetical protein VF941_17135, partial [Clostridia bacterium]